MFGAFPNPFYRWRWHHCVIWDGPRIGKQKKNKKSLCCAFLPNNSIIVMDNDDELKKNKE